MSSGLLAFGVVVALSLPSTHACRSLRLLAEFPEVRVNGAKGVLYDAVEAAELDEPGAMAALIELKLSANAQFQDRPEPVN